MILYFILLKRVIGVVKAWIENYTDDFWDDNTLLEELKNFIVKMTNVLEAPAQQLSNILQKRVEKHRATSFVDNISVIHSIDTCWLTMDEKKVAEQICFLEFRLYSAITAKETLNQNWSKHKEKSPNVLALIEQFNRVYKLLLYY